MFESLIFLGIILLLLAGGIKMWEKYGGNERKKLNNNHTENKHKDNISTMNEPLFNNARVITNKEQNFESINKPYSQVQQDRQPHVDAIDNGLIIELFNQGEYNRDQRNIDIKNSLSLINFFLFIIAAALCIIAYCCFYDYSVKKEFITQIEKTLNEILSHLPNIIY